jgi:hypothetical protein
MYIKSMAGVRNQKIFVAFCKSVTGFHGMSDRPAWARERYLRVLSISPLTFPTSIQKPRIVGTKYSRVGYSKGGSVCLKADQGVSVLCQLNASELQHLIYLVPIEKGRERFGTIFPRKTVRDG